MKHIKTAALDLGQPTPESSLIKFKLYHRLIDEFSKTFNLTAISGWAKIRDQLFIRSLRIASQQGGNIPPGDWFDGKTLLDVGTGAGIPGIPLKIIFPKLNITLLDSNKKKCFFLEKVIRELELEKIKIVNERAEILARNVKFREKYDVVTARGLAPLAVLIELCMPFVSIGGTAIFPKGNNISQEITKAHYAAEKLGSAPPIYTSISNPGSSAPDKMVYFLKISPTPNYYPRRPGIPKKKPLGNSI